MLMEYGERLKAARKHKGWSQKQLEEKSGVGQGSISKIERGEQEEGSSAFDIPLARALGVSAEWLYDGAQKHEPYWLSNNKQTNELHAGIKDLDFLPQKGKIPVVRFEHEEITKLINSPNQHTGEFMKTFMDFGEKCFGVILDERHRGLDQPGTVVVFDPDAEPTLDDDCYVLVSFPNIAGRYEIMRHIQYAGDLSLESLSGRAPPVSIRLTGAKIHARAIKRIGDL